VPGVAWLFSAILGPVMASTATLRKDAQTVGLLWPRAATMQIQFISVLQSAMTVRPGSYRYHYISLTNLPQKRSQIERGYGGGPYDAIIIGLDAPFDRSCH
jgi:hypothetical protein